MHSRYPHKTPGIKNSCRIARSCSTPSLGDQHVKLFYNIASLCGSPPTGCSTSPADLLSCIFLLCFNMFLFALKFFPQTTHFSLEWQSYAYPIAFDLEKQLAWRHISQTHTSTCHFPLCYASF